MGELDLDAIEARAEAASKGAWVVVGRHLCCAVGGCNCYGPGPGQPHEPYCGVEPFLTMMATEPESIGQRDLDFIAHARADVPALVAEVRRLRALLGGDDRG